MKSKKILQVVLFTLLATGTALVFGASTDNEFGAMKLRGAAAYKVLGGIIAKHYAECSEAKPECNNALADKINGMKDLPGKATARSTGKSLIVEIEGHLTPYVFGVKPTGDASVDQLTRTWGIEAGRSRSQVIQEQDKNVLPYLIARAKDAIKSRGQTESAARLFLTKYAHRAGVHDATLTEDGDVLVTTLAKPKGRKFIFKSDTKAEPGSFIDLSEK